MEKDSIDKSRLERKLQELLDDNDAKSKALDELKEDFKQALQFKN